MAFYDVLCPFFSEADCGPRLLLKLQMEVGHIFALLCSLVHDTFVTPVIALREPIPSTAIRMDCGTIPQLASQHNRVSILIEHMQCIEVNHIRIDACMHSQLTFRVHDNTYKCSLL